MNPPIALSIFCLAVLSACTPIPIYKAPTDLSQAAHFKVAFTDESILAGVAIVYRTEGELFCGEPLPGFERMVTISKGNPLISDLNAAGTYIPAGRKFSLSAMGLNDGFRGCSKVLSFLPQVGHFYELELTNQTDRNPYLSKLIACPVLLTELDKQGKSLGPVEITVEECKPRK